MSPPPQVGGPFGSAGRSETNNSDRPPIGGGQKSAALELIGAPRLRGSPNGASIEARSAAQMSLPPSVPGRLDAIIRLRPSGVSIGQPSPAGVLTSATRVALLHSGRYGSGPPWAWLSVA